MKRFTKNVAIYVMIFLMVLMAGIMYNGGMKSETREVKFSTITSYFDAKKVTDVNITDMKITAKVGEDKYVYAYASNIVDLQWLEEKYILPQMHDKTLTYHTDDPKSYQTILSLIPTIIMVVALGFLFYIMMNQGGNGKAFQFGKSRAKLYTEDQGRKITFKDVAGLKEEKQELEEIVDFLKDPDKYKDVGARIPKGVLLVGPPGTGKTYVSRATAGEAGVPFYTISGSDFVEMFVGVGASRVRDLFGQAKKNAPCIVFIDEIDAVGRKRGAGLGGGNDEREQTLNQLLVEMDGFGENTGIIVMAATNRPDVLDPALLRPGRFDRQITIGIPDIKGREEIIKVHSKGKPLAPDVSPEIIARGTPGFTPADLENLLNEAALITARRNGKWIRMTAIEEATEKVIAGPAKKSRVISPEEKKLTAFHEAGHAIVMRSIPGSDPVHTITIIPRGQAGGYTLALPEQDRFFETRQNMKNQIVHLLGGRVSESLTLDDISTGASNDIERATDIARAMVTKYGFSEKLGPVNYSGSDEPFLGRDYTTKKNWSDGVASEIDEEVRKIMVAAYKEAEDILKTNMDKLNRVAEALIRVETLDGEQFEKLYTGEATPDDIENEIREKEEKIRVENEKEAQEMQKKREEEKLRALELQEEMILKQREEAEKPGEYNGLVGLAGQKPDVAESDDQAAKPSVEDASGSQTEPEQEAVASEKAAEAEVENGEPESEHVDSEEAESQMAEGEHRVQPDESADDDAEEESDKDSEE